MAEEKAKTKDRIHTVYKTKDGERVPSVTTVLGILNKPALLDWAWQLGTQGLDYKAVRDNAGDIGTLAHYLIMCDLKGGKPDTSEYSPQDLDRAETCLIKYYDWRKGKDLKIIHIEKPLVSEQYGFGGTIDCLAMLDGKPVLVDYKTGKAIYPEMFYQLAAYEHLIKETGIAIDHSRILRIGRTDDEGFEERLSSNLDKHWQLFLNCLSIYKLQNEIRRAK